MSIVGVTGGVDSPNLGTTTTSDKRHHSHRDVLHPPPETKGIVRASSCLVTVLPVSRAERSSSIPLTGWLTLRLKAYEK